MIGEMFQSLKRDLGGSDEATRASATAPFRAASRAHTIYMINGAQNVVALGLDGGPG